MEGLAKNVKNENTNKSEKLIQLYKQRKKSNVKSAKKHILNFIEYSNAKHRRKKTIDTNYDKIIANYQDSKTLSEKSKRQKQSNCGNKEDIKTC